MVINRHKWAIALAILIVVVALGVGGAALGLVVPRTNPADWALSGTEVAQAREALVRAAIDTDPSAAAGSSSKSSGSWPSNVKSGIAFGTDRGAANTAMGEPGAVTGAEARRRVVCAQAHGTFSTASLTHPAGAKAQTFSYAVVCFDPNTGDVTDTGYDNNSVSGSFPSAINLNVAATLSLGL